MKSWVVMAVLVAASIWVGIPAAGAQDMPPRMSEADTDKDGKVSLDEFLAHCKERFARLDADKDGYISADEGKKSRSGKGDGKGR